MELEILQENLSRALTTVTRILTSKPQMPILANILLTATDGRLTIVASNLETTILVESGAKVVKNGTFAVPGRTFLETVSALAAEKVSLSVEEGILTIRAGQFKAKINGIAAQEYPKLTETGKLSSPLLEIDKEQFIKAIKKIAFAAATDESRAVLTGVLFQPKGENLTLAATDGFRLSVVNLPRVKMASLEENKIIVPARSLVEAERAAGTEKMKIYFLNNSHQIFFDLGDVKIYSRLIAGNFPEFEKIIPSESMIKIVVPIDEFSKAVRLAAIFARDSANIVKLKVPASPASTRGEPAGEQSEKLKVSANAPQMGENESEIDVQIEKGGGEDFSIAFNCHYLLDLLGSLGGAEITMEFTNPLASGVFRIPSEPDFLHLIMPVRVQS